MLVGSAGKLKNVSYPPFPLICGAMTLRWPWQPLWPRVHFSVQATLKSSSSDVDPSNGTFPLRRSEAAGIRAVSDVHLQLTAGGGGGGGGGGAEGGAQPLLLVAGLVCTTGGSSLSRAPCS